MTDATERVSYLALAIASDQMADASTSKVVARLHRKLAARYRALGARAEKEAATPPAN